MKPAFFLLVIAGLLGLAGCLPVSQNPLSSPEKATADARLAGVWYGKSGEDTIFLHFVAGDTAKMDIVEVDHQKNGDAHTNIYTMFPTVIGDTRFMNVQEKKGANKSYYLARYQISTTGSLTIWLMSEKAVTKAIKGEKISGKVVEKNSANGTPDHDVTVTASTEKLAAFVGKSDPEILFAEKFGTFKKVTLPALEAAATPKSSPTPAKKNVTPAKSPAKKKRTATQ